MHGRDDRENLRILKKSQLEVDIGQWSHRVEGWIWAIEDLVGIFGSLPTEILNTTRCATCGYRVSMVKTVFLSSCRRTEVSN